MSEPSALDAAFDKAFDHLSECRQKFEDDPRNPDVLSALGAARAALEDARNEMREERKRLGYEGSKLRHEPPHRPGVDADPPEDLRS